MAFNPNEHLTKLKGKDYLEVKYRLVWLRDACPNAEITTSIMHLDIEKGIAVFKATVKDGQGGIGEGHGSESVKDFGDYIEKAETKAIGRALAALGYGTQFAPEIEEGARVVDSPVATPATRPAQESKPAPKPERTPTRPAQPTTPKVESKPEPKPVSLDTLISHANKYYPGGWLTLKDAIKQQYHLSIEVDDELVQSEYNGIAQALIRQSANGRQPVTAGK